MSDDKKKVSLDDILADASPVEHVVNVCVAGKLVAEYQQLEAELERTQAADPMDRRLGSSGPDGNATAIAQKMRDLAEKMREATYAFRFRALSPKAWSDLVAKHPDKSSSKRLFDPETFPPAAIAACCIEPEGMDDPEKVAALMEKLSVAQQADLFDGAWEVNTSAPKEMNSSAAYAALLHSEQSWNTRVSTESPGASSSDE